MSARRLAALLLALFCSAVFAYASARVEQRNIEIQVVDREGAPIEEFGWLLVLQSPSSQSSVPEAIQARPGGRATLHVPDGRATLEIRTERFKAPAPVVLPERAPTQALRITLFPRPALCGRVLFEGVSVPGATVELVRREPNRFGEQLFGGYWSGLYTASGRNSAQTDESGSFRYAFDFPPPEFYVHAWAPGFAEGFAGPVRDYNAPIEVSLSVGATLEGRLLLPSDRHAQGLVVEVFRKRLDAVTSALGTSFKVQADVEGRWSVDSLGAGPWMVRVMVSNPAAVGLDPLVAKRCFDVPWLFDVVADSTAHVELDLAADTFCTLEAQLKIGVLVNSGYAELFLEAPLALNPTVAPIDTTGHFTLRTRRAGHYRIIVHPGIGNGVDRFVTDVVELALGTNAWNKELTPATWTGRGVRFDQR